MEKSNTPPNILWHYTSTQAAADIITNDELWVTDQRFLNDTSEFSHGLEIYCTEAEKVKFKSCNTDTNFLCFTPFLRFRQEGIISKKIEDDLPS